jgi:hypothetical protein
MRSTTEAPAAAEATAPRTAATEATAESAATPKAVAATAAEAARVALEAAARLLLPLRCGGTAARALLAPGGVLLPVAGGVALDRTIAAREIVVAAGHAIARSAPLARVVVRAAPIGGRPGNIVRSRREDRGEQGGR